MRGKDYDLLDLPQVQARLAQPPMWAVSRMGCIAGAHFTSQPAGTVHCPAGFPLYPKARRPERDGSVRVIYAARIDHCRSCPRREERQSYRMATKKPRQCSALATRYTRGDLSSSAFFGLQNYASKKTFKNSNIRRQQKSLAGLSVPYHITSIGAKSPGFS